MSCVGWCCAPSWWLATASAQSWSRSDSSAERSSWRTRTGQKRRAPVGPLVGRAEKDARPAVLFLHAPVGGPEHVGDLRDEILDAHETRPTEGVELGDLDDPVAVERVHRVLVLQVGEAPQGPRSTENARRSGFAFALADALEDEDVVGLASGVVGAVDTGEHPPAADARGVFVVVGLEIGV